MEQTLKNKVILVTGGARRVGRALALGFASAGASVAIHHGQSDDDAESTAEEIRAFGVEALVLKADLNQHAAVGSMFSHLEKHFGRIDVLVNSASNFHSGDLLDVSAEEWDLALGVNLRAPFWCTQYAGRIMRDHKIAGSIVNISDNSGRRPWDERPQHSVSKAGLIMLTQVTAKSLAQYQIRANCLVLGPVLPSPGQGEKDIAETAERLPLGRWGAPEDAARAAVFLASNDFITGSVLNVDGGEWLA